MTCFHPPVKRLGSSAHLCELEWSYSIFLLASLLGARLRWGQSSRKPLCLWVGVTPATAQHDGKVKAMVTPSPTTPFLPSTHNLGIRWVLAIKKKDDNFASMFSNFAVTATSCELMWTIFQEASWGLFMFSSCSRADMVKQGGEQWERGSTLHAGFQSRAVSHSSIFRCWSWEGF